MIKIKEGAVLKCSSSKKAFEVGQKCTECQDSEYNIIYCSFSPLFVAVFTGWGDQKHLEHLGLGDSVMTGDDSMTVLIVCTTIHLITMIVTHVKFN